MCSKVTNFILCDIVINNVVLFKKITSSMRVTNLCNFKNPWVKQLYKGLAYCVPCSMPQLPIRSAFYNINYFLPRLPLVRVFIFRF